MTWSDRRVARLPLLALLVVGLAGGSTAGCWRTDTGLELRSEVRRGSFAVGGMPLLGLGFTVKPELTDVTVNYERRPAVLTTTSWSWVGKVPKRATVHAGVQLIPPAWRALKRFEARITVRDGDLTEVLAVGRSQPGEMRWVDLEGDLSPYAGRTVTLEFSVVVPHLPAEHRRSNLVAWGPVRVSSYRPTSAERQRPNILFILVDTLRYDHLASYGYKREVTPEITRLLGEPGAVVEEAYSQAPWTLPSVVSFLTGRYPGEMLGSDLASFGIPERVEPLAQHLAKLGYDTGGFIGNPSLHAGAGFERGFSTFFAPPADLEWMNRHADDVNSHAVPWLRAHQDRPFFAYVHYIDPHDPYQNPDMVDGRSQFDRGYTGPVAGDWIHGIYAGKIQLQDPARDIAYIQAMYDSEVHYVDRYVGRLLESLKPEVLNNTLVVLTADHGEELFDHGGWKHGQTLYEEQIHVPLLVRWDGRIPAGRRVAGTVRLLDLVPTLSAAAGGKPDPAWEGIDLLPALTGRGPLPKRPAFAQHLAAGPLRAAAVLDREKLIVFNPAEPFRSVDELQDYLWRHDLERMKRRELYDLKQDPHERQNLAESEPQRALRLEPVIERRLDGALAGLRLFAQGLPAGRRIEGTVIFARPPAAAVPYFLAPADRAELAGTTLRFSFLGEPAGPGAKGVRIEGDFGRIERLEATLDGQPLEAGRVRLGAGTSYAGGAVSLAGLEASTWPDPGAAPSLLLWTHRPARPGERRTAHDPETERRLRALGYIQ